MFQTDLFKKVEILEDYEPESPGFNPIPLTAPQNKSVKLATLSLALKEKNLEAIKKEEEKKKREEGKKQLKRIKIQKRQAIQSFLFD